VLEASACGIPTVVTDCSALSEVGAAGWKVGGEEFWNPTHRATWIKPSIPQLAKVYETAYQRGKEYTAKKAKARDFALQYDTERVLVDYWKPCLDWLEPLMAERRAKYAAESATMEV
jgi:glycosyltransferase involved in cell wall biosynthesis